MDDRDLEQLLRGGLAAHAEEAGTTAPVVDRVRADVGRRRRTRWSAVAAAAAVAVIAGGTSVVALGGGDEPDRDADLPPAADSQGAADGEWRTEYWADVAVDVPADWGYGGAPHKTGGSTLACWPTAMVDATGQRVEDRRPSLGWVGRPIVVTDVCELYPWIEHSSQLEPAAPYVWLGAEVEPGIVEYDNGYVQETVEVGGTTVTVGTRDDALRERILSSARGGETCTANVAQIPRGDYATTTEGRGELLHAEVCAYRRDDEGDYWLSYVRELAPEIAEATYGAAEAAPRATVDCDYDPFEFVVVQATYDDPFGSEDLHRTAVYTMGCGGSVDIGDRFPAHTMTPESVEPWATSGIPAVVVGPSDARWVYDYFIGLQG